MKLTVALCNNSDCSPSNQTAPLSSRVCSHGSCGLFPFRPKMGPCVWFCFFFCFVIASVLIGKEMHQASRSFAFFLFGVCVCVSALFLSQTGKIFCAIRASRSFYITWFYTRWHIVTLVPMYQVIQIRPLVISHLWRKICDSSVIMTMSQRTKFDGSKKNLALTRWLLKSYLLKTYTVGHICQTQGQQARVVVIIFRPGVWIVSQFA